MTRIAIMQPYFVPYAGYFRLFAHADLFVIYDCVQFTRRGYIHRNQLPDTGGKPQWLTLPLRSAPRETRIDEMCLADDAPARLTAQCRRFPSLTTLPESWATLFATAQGPLVPWLTRSLDMTCTALGITTPMRRSSSLDLPGSLKGQERIIAICERLGASAYVNAPAGRDLYDATRFSAHGITLEFLPPYDGPKWSILHVLMTEGSAATAARINGGDTE
jgi:hypothetical protein